MSIPARDITYFRQVGTSPLEAWYSNQTTALAPGAATLADDTLMAVPFVVGRGCTIDRIGMEVTLLGVLSKARIGIYNATSPVNLYPSSLVVDSGELDTTSAGVKSATISQVLKPGLYWLAHLSDSTGGLATVRTIGGAGCFPIFGTASTLPTESDLGLTVAQAYGALPSTFTASASTIDSTTDFPIIAVRLST